MKGKEQVTSDSYIKHLQFLGCGFCRAVWIGREVFVSDEGEGTGD